MKAIPVIGVLPLWDAEKKSLWMLTEYMEAVQAAGGVPVVLPFYPEKEPVEQLVAMCDGFLFTGGQDVAPEVYGKTDETDGMITCPCRDSLEILVLKAALDAGKPIFGICRGLQFINAVLGGTLWQDLPSQRPGPILHRQGKPYDKPAHRVTLYGELEEYLGKKTLAVNTLHHQAVLELAPGLEALAISEDGLVEAFGMTGRSSVWAVQWHPEYMFKVDPDSLRLFERFVSDCR